jgi:hypothetical protein
MGIIGNVENHSALPNLGRSVIETFFYILRKQASFGRALQIPEQSSVSRAGLRRVLAPGLDVMNTISPHFR